MTTDYDVIVKLRLDDVRTLVAEAKEFVAAAEHYLSAL